MNTDKIGFFLKLNPPRSSFTHDMTAEERSIMQQHLAYWDPFVNDGTIIALGPVFDPKGGFGIGVIRVDNEEQLKDILAKDPANGLNSYEVYPMRIKSKY